MSLLGFTVVLGLLLGVWAQHNVLRPLCDSPKAEEAALVAQDYLNGQHTHGYKYALNRIEDIKVQVEVSQGVVKGKDIRYLHLFLSTWRWNRICTTLQNTLPVHFFTTTGR